MTRIILCGCSGAMGQNVMRAVGTREGCVIVAGVDIDPRAKADYPVFASISECTIEADVIVDFTHPSLTLGLIDYAKSHGLGIVMCTTGHSDEQIAAIKTAGEDIPMFYSGNMSLGINLLISLAKKAASVLGESFDIEIVEQHHNQKLDAPSGTAIMIANAISDSLPSSPRYEYDRHSRRMKRPKDEIGIHSVRGGTIVGVHEVIFAGQDETISLTHTAQSKGLFASGAVSAAIFLTGKPAGLYDMNDMLSEA